MRFCIIPLLLLLTSCNEKAVIIHDTNALEKEKFVKAKLIVSKADSINTEEDVIEYLKAIDTNFNRFTIEKIPFSGALKNPDFNDQAKDELVRLNLEKSYFKADFDNNGYTDLLVVGGWGAFSTDYLGKRLHYDTYAVLNFGRDSLKIHSLERNLTSSTVPEIRYKNGEPYIVMHPLLSKENKEIRLTGKFGAFIEFNDKPVDNKIEKIEFAAGPCFGTCPMFAITINKDKSAVFLAEHYNFSKDRNTDFSKKEGLFKAIVKDTEFNQIVSLLNYIDFKNLNDSYSVSYTDAPSASLRITYLNGKIKEIEDYGMSGTYGLSAVYEFFRDLRFNQQWVKTE